MKEKRLQCGFSKSETFLNDADSPVITLERLVVIVHSKLGYETIKTLLSEVFRSSM